MNIEDICETGPTVYSSYPSTGLLFASQYSVKCSHADRKGKVGWIMYLTGSLDRDLGRYFMDSKTKIAYFPSVFLPKRAP